MLENAVEENTVKRNEKETVAKDEPVTKKVKEELPVEPKPRITSSES